MTKVNQRIAFKLAMFAMLAISFKFPSAGTFVACLYAIAAVGGIFMKEEELIKDIKKDRENGDVSKFNTYLGYLMILVLATVGHWIIATL